MYGDSSSSSVILANQVMHKTLTMPSMKEQAPRGSASLHGATPEDDDIVNRLINLNLSRNRKQSRSCLTRDKMDLEEHEEARRRQVIVKIIKQRLNSSKNRGISKKIPIPVHDFARRLDDILFRLANEDMDSYSNIDTLDSRLRQLMIKLLERRTSTKRLVHSRPKSFVRRPNMVPGIVVGGTGNKNGNTVSA